MDAFLTSVVAVVGTLLGSVVSYFFRVRATDRSAEHARAEKLRQERIDAYCSYAGALLEYRRVLVLRWFVRNEDRPEENTPELMERVYTTRYAAQEAMFRVQMVTGSSEVAELAEHALDSVTDLHNVATREELDRCRDASRQAIREFVAVGKEHTG